MLVASLLVALDSLCSEANDIVLFHSLRSAFIVTAPLASRSVQMMIFQCAEVFAENIPVTVLQVNALLTSVDLDFIVMIALLLTLAFASNAVAYLTYVKDIGSESRRTGKLFYGFMPLSGVRLVLGMGSLHVLSFCQLLAKSISIALLFQMGGKTLVIIVLGCEMGVFLTYKLARQVRTMDD